MCVCVHACVPAVSGAVEVGKVKIVTCMLLLGELDTEREREISHCNAFPSHLLQNIMSTPQVFYLQAQ